MAGPNDEKVDDDSLFKGEESSYDEKGNIKITVTEPTVEEKATTASPTIPIHHSYNRSQRR